MPAVPACFLEPLSSGHSTTPPHPCVDRRHLARCRRQPRVADVHAPVRIKRPKHRSPPEPDAASEIRGRADGGDLHATRRGGRPSPFGAEGWSAYLAPHRSTRQGLHPRCEQITTSAGQRDGQRARSIPGPSLGRRTSGPLGTSEPASVCFVWSTDSQRRCPAPRRRCRGRSAGPLHSQTDSSRSKRLR